MNRVVYMLLQTKMVIPPDKFWCHMQYMHIKHTHPSKKKLKKVLVFFYFAMQRIECLNKNWRRIPVSLCIISVCTFTFVDVLWINCPIKNTCFKSVCTTTLTNLLNECFPVRNGRILYAPCRSDQRYSFFPHLEANTGHRSSECLGG